MSVYVSDRIVITDENFEDIAETLPYIGRGATRKVYDLGDVVLKVTTNFGHCVGHCADEADVWEQVKGTKWSSLFAPVLASGEGWLIMAKADTDGISYSELINLEGKLNAIGIGDLHEGNVGYLDGDLVAIDYSFNRAGTLHLIGSPSSSSFEQCECGEHDCEACYPEGCECCCSLHVWEGCESLQGCNKQECDQCYVTAAVKWQEPFGFLRGVMQCNDKGIGQVKEHLFEHACREHAPVSQLPNILKAQCKGQGRFVEARDRDGRGELRFVFDAVTQHFIERTRRSMGSKRLGA